jgi:general secretion pathway protein K
VLWGLALLSLIAAMAIAGGHQATALGAGRVGEIRAGLLAEAGIERAILAIDQSPNESAWPEDGAPVKWDFGGGRIVIAIEDEGGKINALQAPDMMLQAALEAAGLSSDRSARVLAELHAARIRAQRLSSLTGIASLDDLRTITSLTGGEIARLRPFMTLRSGLAGLDPQVASAATLRLLPLANDAMIDDYLQERAATLARADAPDRPAPPAQAFTSRSQRIAFTVRAEACTSDGYQAIREAMIRRDSPGHYAHLEMREPIHPRFLTGGCQRTVNAALAGY